MVEERVVYAEVAEYCLYARLYTDLCVSENGVVLIIDHSSVHRLVSCLLGVQGVASVVCDRHKQPSPVESLLFLELAGVETCKNGVFGLDNKANIHDVIDVLMEVSFVPGVKFVKQSSMEDPALGIFLNMIDKCLFEVLPLEKNIVIEESLCVRDHPGHILLFNHDLFLFLFTNFALAHGT